MPPTSHAARAAALLALLLLSAADALAQRPTIMALPSDRYCNERGYVTEFASTAGATVSPDYRRALLEDRYLSVALSTINAAFQEAGYPIQDLEMALRSVDFSEAEALLSDRPTQQTMRDRLLSQARSDIVLELDFFEERAMGGTSLSMTIEALDAYSAQALASVTQTGQPGRGTPFSVLVREAVVQNMPTFESRLMGHFEDLGQNGRVGVIEVRLGADAPFDLEEWISLPDGTEEELGTVVRDLIRRSAINGRHHMAVQTRTQQTYDEVRVPLFDDEGYPMDVPTWANAVLVRRLRSQFGLDVRRETVGMGHARLLILGYR